MTTPRPTSTRLCTSRASSRYVKYSLIETPMFAAAAMLIVAAVVATLALAQQLIPDAKLTSFEFDPVFPDGRVDLAQQRSGEVNHCHAPVVGGGNFLIASWIGEQVAS